MSEANDQLTQEMLVSLLAEAPEEYLAADAICGKLGLPKAVFFRQVEELRQKGYRIDVRPTRGYRLMEVPDRLTALELSPLLATTDLGRTIHAFDEVDSTNETARALAEDGASHGELVVAESQRRGRGRRGRSWVSQPGEDLTFSLILRPDLPLSRAHELTIAAGVALGEVLREASFDVTLKWPNDILIGGKKVAGILIESAGDDRGLRYVVLGIGLNVNAAALPPELSEIATSLRLARGEVLPRALLLAAILEALERWMEKTSAQGPAEALGRTRTWSATVGRRVRVEASSPVDGVAEAIDDNGALLVRDDQGQLHCITAGDVGIL